MVIGNSADLSPQNLLLAGVLFSWGIGSSILENVEQKQAPVFSWYRFSPVSSRHGQDSSVGGLRTAVRWWCCYTVRSSPERTCSTIFGVWQSFLFSLFSIFHNCLPIRMENYDTLVFPSVVRGELVQLQNMHRQLDPNSTLIGTVSKNDFKYSNLPCLLFDNIGLWLPSYPRQWYGLATDNNHEMSGLSIALQTISVRIFFGRVFHQRFCSWISFPCS